MLVNIRSFPFPRYPPGRPDRGKEPGSSRGCLHTYIRGTVWTEYIVSLFVRRDVLHRQHPYGTTANRHTTLHMCVSVASMVACYNSLLLYFGTSLQYPFTSPTRVPLTPSNSARLRPTLMNHVDPVQQIANGGRLR